VAEVLSEFAERVFESNGVIKLAGKEGGKLDKCSGLGISDRMPAPCHYQNLPRRPCRLTKPVDRGLPFFSTRSLNRFLKV
jgi:hypothetical protein